MQRSLAETLHFTDTVEQGCVYSTDISLCSEQQENEKGSIRTSTFNVCFLVILHPDSDCVAQTASRLCEVLNLSVSGVQVKLRRKL